MTLILAHVSNNIYWSPFLILETQPGVFAGMAASSRAGSSSTLMFQGHPRRVLVYFNVDDTSPSLVDTLIHVSLDVVA